MHSEGYSGDVNTDNRGRQLGTDLEEEKEELTAPGTGEGDGTALVDDKDVSIEEGVNGTASGDEIFESYEEVQTFTLSEIQMLAKVGELNEMHGVKISSTSMSLTSCNECLVKMYN